MSTVSIAHKSRITKFPTPTYRSERSFAALFTQSPVLAFRLLTVWSRDPLTMVQAVLYPALMLVIIRIVLGDSVTRFNSMTLISGTNYAKPDSIYGTVPMMMLIAAMLGSVAGAVLLMQERKSGLLARLWVIPVHRAADLLGRAIAEAVRIVITTALLAVVGVAAGFRFHEGFLPSVALLGIPVLFGVAFGVAMMAAALASSKATLVEVAALAVSLMMFFNAGFVPISGYPAWAQPIVQHQPMTYAIETMRALAIGGEVAGSLPRTLLWLGAFLAVAVVPAIRGYRKSATGDR